MSDLSPKRVRNGKSIISNISHSKLNKLRDHRTNNMCNSNSIEIVQGQDRSPLFSQSIIRLKSENEERIDRLHNEISTLQTVM